MSELNYELIGRLARAAAELEESVYTLGLALTRSDEERTILENALASNRKVLVTVVRRNLIRFLSEIAVDSHLQRLLPIIDSLGNVFDIRDGSVHAVPRIRGLSDAEVSGFEPYFYWPRAGEAVELSESILVGAINQTVALMDELFDHQTAIVKELRTQIKYEGYLITVFSDSEGTLPKWIYQWTPEGSLQYVEVRSGPPPSFELLLPLTQIHDLRFRLSNIGLAWKESPEIEIL